MNPAPPVIRNVFMGIGPPSLAALRTRAARELLSCRRPHFNPRPATGPPAAGTTRGPVGPRRAGTAPPGGGRCPDARPDPSSAPSREPSGRSPGGPPPRSPRRGTGRARKTGRIRLVPQREHRRPPPFEGEGLMDRGETLHEAPHETRPREATQTP